MSFDPDAQIIVDIPKRILNQLAKIKEHENTIYMKDAKIYYLTKEKEELEKQLEKLKN